MTERKLERANNLIKRIRSLQDDTREVYDKQIDNGFIAVKKEAIPDYVFDEIVRTVKRESEEELDRLIEEFEQL